MGRNLYFVKRFGIMKVVVLRDKTDIKIGIYFRCDNCEEFYKRSR